MSNSSTPVAPADAWQAGDISDLSDAEQGFWTGVRVLQAEFSAMKAHIEDDDGVFYIARLECVDPGKKIGSAYMLRLLALADEFECDLSIEPEAPDSERGGRLVRWYERLGFAFENDQRMVRPAGEAIPDIINAAAPRLG